MNGFQPTDYDQLHRVVSGCYWRGERRVGKTYAHCHELAGILSVTDASLAVGHIATTHRLTHILPMLLHVFDEHGIHLVRSYKQDRRFFFDVPGRGTKEVLFVPYERQHHLRGLSNYEEVDFHD